MKRLTAVRATAMLALTVLLLAPGTTHAEGTTCESATGYIPDGRILRSTIPAATTFWFRVETVLTNNGENGRSYTVEVHFDTSTLDAPAPAVTVWHGSGGCGSPQTLTDRKNTDPGLPYTGARLSFIYNFMSEPLVTPHWISIQNNTGVTQTYTLVVNDTTLFSTAWSTIGTYDTYYSLYNTTNSTCYGRLNLFRSGVALTSTPVTIPAGTTTSTNTKALGFPRNWVGTATFIHDCPAGAILAEAAIANFNITPTPYFQSVKFAPVRETAH